MAKGRITNSLYCSKILLLTADWWRIWWWRDPSTKLAIWLNLSAFYVWEKTDSRIKLVFSIYPLKEIT